MFATVHYRCLLVVLIAIASLLPATDASFYRGSCLRIRKCRNTNGVCTNKEVSETRYGGTNINPNPTQAPYQAEPDDQVYVMVAVSQSIKAVRSRAPNRKYFGRPLCADSDSNSQECKEGEVIAYMTRKQVETGWVRRPIYTETANAPRGILGSYTIDQKYAPYNGNHQFARWQSRVHRNTRLNYEVYYERSFCGEWDHSWHKQPSHNWYSNYYYDNFKKLADQRGEKLGLSRNSNSWSREGEGWGWQWVGDGWGSEWGDKWVSSRGFPRSERLRKWDWGWAWKQISWDWNDNHYRRLNTVSGEPVNNGRSLLAGSGTLENNANYDAKYDEYKIGKFEYSGDGKYITAKSFEEADELQKYLKTLYGEPEKRSFSPAKKFIDPRKLEEFIGDTASEISAFSSPTLNQFKLRNESTRGNINTWKFIHRHKLITLRKEGLTITGRERDYHVSDRHGNAYTASYSTGKSKLGDLFIGPDGHLHQVGGGKISDSLKKREAHLIKLMNYTDVLGGKMTNSPVSPTNLLKHMASKKILYPRKPIGSTKWPARRLGHSERRSNG